uniref:Uncharacterized protein n=2 Tax=Arion vulgaris TaxID=1028688 RepID=A0A0B7BBM4_9EUPU
MAEKQNLINIYNEGENVELDNPVAYPEYPAPPYSYASNNSGVPYTGDPYTGAPYARCPYTNAPYTFAPHEEAPQAGAPFSQYTSTAALVEQPRQTTTVISQNSLARGDLEGAAARGREARNYSLWSIVVAIMGATIYIIIHFAVLH